LKDEKIESKPHWVAFQTEKRPHNYSLWRTGFAQTAKCWQHIYEKSFLCFSNTTWNRYRCQENLDKDAEHSAQSRCSGRIQGALIVAPDSMNPRQQGWWQKVFSCPQSRKREQASSALELWLLIPRSFVIKLLKRIRNIFPELVKPRYESSCIVWCKK